MKAAPNVVERSYQIAGLMKEQVTDLQVLAADVQDAKNDVLLDELRLAVIRLGDRLTELRRRQRNAVG